MLRDGQTVRIHYAGTLESGTDFVNTWITGGPVTVTVGRDEFLPAFNEALKTLGRGERAKVHVPAAEAYGPWDPDAVIQVPREQIPNSAALKEGGFVFMGTSIGPVKVRVAQVGEDAVTIDCNHELAGHDLDFEIELVTDGTESLVEREQMGTGCGCGCDKLKEALAGDACGCGHHHADGTRRESEGN